MKSISTLLAFLLFTSIGFSQLEPTGFIPGSDYAFNVYADENVALASVASRLFRSTDNGENWIQVTEGLGPGTLGSGMIERVDGVLLLASSSREKLYRSTDNGASWEPANSGIEGPLTVQSVYTMTSSEGNIFIGHDYMLKRSTYQGLTWEDTELSNNCTALANLDGEIWVGQQNQVHYSTDDGETWSTINSDPHSHEAATVMDFAIQGDRIFAGLSYDDESALKYTDDHGNNWETLGSFNLVKEVIVDDSSLYISTSNGIHSSQDSGETWSQFPDLTANSYDLEVSMNQLWATSFSGIEVFDLMTSEIFIPQFSLGRAIEIANIDQTLFNISNDILYRSTNNGDTWENIMQNVPGEGTLLYNLQAHGSNLLVSGGSQNELAAISSDGGDSFEEIPLTPNGTAAQLMDGDRIFSFSFIDYTFWYSDDLGESWESATKFPAEIDNGFNTFECIEKVGDLLIAGFTGGVAVSTNNGEHWNFHETSGSVFNSIAGWDNKIIAIVLDELNGDRTIMKSTNNGETWTEASTGFAPQSDEIWPMELMMLNDRVYCTNGAGENDEDSGKIFALNESGNWFEVPELGVPPMEVICMTETTAGIFAGLRSYGVWTTQDVAFGLDEQDNRLSEINLYPNPASEFIQVETTESVNYQIRNINGQLVQFGKTNSRDQRIEIGSLDSGMYFFSIQNNKGLATKRFIVN